ncbi:MAG: 2-oxoglutarate dehydrogenase E1 component [Microscillaceae bacterium]|nr:2-oxoglutarate dehydrogenase E1 component [Microscillaceae bacterium]MDW8459691.1 2-oxoglutarate dehydrogenase E1 component [Cytophagales bacterium]
MDKYSYIANAHGNYIDQLYRSYKQNPDSIDASWKHFFEGFDFSLDYLAQNGGAANGAATVTAGIDLKKEIKVRDYIFAFRGRGHLIAKTNPIRPRRDRRALLDLKDFDLTEEDLDTVFQSATAVLGRPGTLRELVAALHKIYAGKIGFEYMYMRDPEMVAWFKNKVEKEYLVYAPSDEEEKRILKKLNEAVVFENFLHTKYVGQKRFSLEGGENTIVALDAIINRSAELGAEEAVIGMAHRGRLNVLVNIMGKTYEQVFNEFEGNIPHGEAYGDGDVKYHMGFSGEVTTYSGKKIMLQLVPNPSHLEAVNPVVEGYARANIDTVYNKNEDKIVPILIHGDAAIAGQGIVYEVVQMSKLAGYYTGGTIHFVINNQVGFTTDFEDARSSIYCTDIAKIVDAPVLHVNGDDPEAVVFAATLAAEFREKFNHDVFIDMVCYRRHGHNESDEPRFTQPKLYSLIENHPTPREVYVETLAQRHKTDRVDYTKQLDKEFREMLQDRLNMVKQKAIEYKFPKLEIEWEHLRRSVPLDFEKSPETGISRETIEKVAKALTTFPEGFTPLKQIATLINNRKKMFFETQLLDWASAELLAYGSLLLEGKIVRLSGQDVERGTFSHRHVIITDANSNEPYCQINHIAEGQAQMQVYNSLLSEYAVLGFEFGYALANPHALVIWEAQFGDFANGAQVMIDQFISCSETKWQRMNGLVLLLPHGYEGQGPEHSSARLERFLQLCADYNMVVVNITQPANFFHALRRQLTWEFRKPLIVMSPKSLLRHPKVVSPIEAFVKGHFQEVLPDNFAEAKEVRKLLFCSGKIYYELLDKQQKDNRKDIAIVRIEQLHPFPAKAVHYEISKYPKAKAYWVQEEPENMGAWTYINSMYKYDKIDYIGRKAAASPATGYYKVHNKEQAEIIEKAFA